MRWFVSPKFQAKAAAWVAKIDAVLAELAALLNGGLDLSNIKAGTQFPLTAFNEPASIVLLRGSLSGFARDVNFGGPVPVAAKILSLGARTGGWPAGLNVDVQVNGATRATVNVKNGGVARLEPPIDVAAGETIAVYLPPFGELGNSFDGTIALRVPHVA